MSAVKIEMNKHGVARVALNRPEVHNAFNAAMIAELDGAFAMLGRHPDVRVILLSGEGKSFSAGADLNWMQAAATASEDANQQDALKMARMFDVLNECPKPVVGLIQGAAMGGGVGLAAACDIVIAHEDAKFALSEVRIGLIPAVISPYVIAKIGESASRRYMVSGERFDAATALRLGLVHEVSRDLDACAKPIVEALLANGPNAMANAKAFIWEVKRLDDPMLLKEITSARIAKIRVSPEGREGIAAFLEKRAASWTE